MNNKNAILFIYLLLFSAIILTCCKKEEDTELPVISNLTIGPDNESVLYKGETINFKFDASDNKELASYQLRIYKDSKGDPPASEGWTFTKTWTIPSGKTTFSADNSEIIVPADALSSNYIFRITVYDAAGNFSKTEVIVPLGERE